MPSSTFEHLNEEKKKQIRAALLTEFSTYSLAEAQVARIVKQAGIARGAFYKYFADLNDAYTYLYRIAIQEIHTPITRTNHMLSAQDYVRQTQDFVNDINGSLYRDLMRLHYQANEGLLDQQQLEIKTHSANEWGVMVLCHETLKECLLKPHNQDSAIARLQEVLQKILQ